MFKTILLPVDGSDASNRAVEAVIALMKGKEEKCKLTVIHIAYVSAFYPELGPETISEKAEEIVGSAVSQIQSEGFDCEGFVKWGYPPNEICAIADETHTDLIVMGSRGLGAFGEMVLGSVSHKVLHLALCPVLVVK